MSYFMYYGWKVHYNGDQQDCLTESEKEWNDIALDYMPDWGYMRDHPKDDNLDDK